LIENMAWFDCDHGQRYFLFGEGGGVREAAVMNVPLLGQIPINSETRERADSGNPVALLEPGINPVADALHQIADEIRKRLSV